MTRIIYYVIAFVNNLSFLYGLIYKLKDITIQGSLPAQRQSLQLFNFHGIKF
ncbi:MAG: hypothetical protein JJU28_11545 [Cyclobacteriaceae bacterium]|nr:hypothetical protein [Cyclobacteriaceae bacterium]